MSLLFPMGNQLLSEYQNFCNLRVNKFWSKTPCNSSCERGVQLSKTYINRPSQDSMQSTNEEKWLEHQVSLLFPMGNQLLSQYQTFCNLRVNKFWSKTPCNSSCERGAQLSKTYSNRPSLDSMQSKNEEKWMEHRLMQLILGHYLFLSFDLILDNE